MDDIAAFIAGLPKAELHIHIEGSLEPSYDGARRAQQGRAALRSIDALRAAYSFANLQDFLDLYYEGMRVLLHEQDFYDLAMAYLKKAASQNVRHAEIFFDPQGHTDRGVPFKTVIDGLWRALKDAEREFGMTTAPLHRVEHRADDVTHRRTVCTAAARAGNTRCMAASQRNSRAMSCAVGGTGPSGGRRKTISASPKRTR